MGEIMPILLAIGVLGIIVVGVFSKNGSKGAENDKKE